MAIRPWLRIGGVWVPHAGSAPVPPTFEGPFDGFVAPHRAMSLRRLLGDYAGAAVRVRRSSDNTELNVGFTPEGGLDTVALLAFAGAGSAFVTTWFDQSGNGRNMTQAGVAAQPRIVNAGVLDTVNSLPAVVFDGTDDLLTSAQTGLWGGAVATVAAVMKSNSATVSNATVFSEARTGTNNQFWRAIRGSSANWNVQATATTSLWASTATGSGLFDMAQHQAFYAEASEVIDTWVDGVPAHAALSAPRTATMETDITALGAHSGLGEANFYNGTMQELVAWASNETSSRTLITTAQKDYWGTP